LDRRLGGPQNHSGCGGEEKIPSLIKEIKQSTTKAGFCYSIITDKSTNEIKNEKH